MLSETELTGFGQDVEDIFNCPFLFAINHDEIIYEIGSFLAKRTGARERERRKKEKEEGKETREAGGESYSPLSYLQLCNLGQLQHKHLNSCIFMVHQFLSLETI